MNKKAITVIINNEIGYQNLPFCIQVAVKLIRVYNKCISEGLPFGMTYSKVKRLMSLKKCQYTGRVFETNYKERGHHNCMTFEKMVPELGYVDSNVVAVTREVNQAIRTLNPEEIILIAENIKKNLQK